MAQEDRLKGPSPRYQSNKKCVSQCSPLNAAVRAMEPGGLPRTQPPRVAQSMAGTREGRRSRSGLRYATPSKHRSTAITLLNARWIPDAGLRHAVLWPRRRPVRRAASHTPATAGGGEFFSSGAGGGLPFGPCTQTWINPARRDPNHDPARVLSWQFLAVFSAASQLPASCERGAQEC